MLVTMRFLVPLWHLGAPLQLRVMVARLLVRHRRESLWQARPMCMRVVPRTGTFFPTLSDVDDMVKRGLRRNNKNKTKNVDLYGLWSLFAMWFGKPKFDS